MTEMREWWANVYPNGTGYDAVGYERPTRDECVSYPGAYLRIHVRLKPEGAPKRYASEANRAMWERAPALCGYLVGGGRAPESLK